MKQPESRLHRIPAHGHYLNAREYPGSGPALLLLHGFPDNLHIYDRLIPLLIADGRRVVAFDFLGFGDSDKPSGFAYSFLQQEADIEAVADYLNLSSFVPVAHDAGSVAAINYLLAHPERVSSLCLLNCCYGDVEGLRFPELIALMATPALRPLAHEMMADPDQFKWLIGLQNRYFKAGLAPEFQKLQDEVLQPIVLKNFAQQPSAGPAFAAMTNDLYATVQTNNGKILRLRALETPVTLLWGASDPYLNLAVARDFTQIFRRATLQTLPAGHWLQIDMPQEVASHLLKAVAGA